ncbi:MAG: ral secretion pathway protein [Thermoanaerobaculia bacterium]|jgi:general secretion pathway protein G|nr:ral secretion pathway protein [Thermoanaerobaculia bacterium]
MNARNHKASSGFTVAELITVVAIVGILASVALPLANFGIRRQKEMELHDRLRKITDAIDKYHELRMPTQTYPGGAIKDPINLEQGPWPKTLEDLTKPIELNNNQKVRLLRERDLIDPMTGKPEWNTLTSDDDPDTTSGGDKNVYELHSKSTALALDGKTHYNEW